MAHQIETVAMWGRAYPEGSSSESGFAMALRLLPSRTARERGHPARVAEFYAISAPSGGTISSQLLRCAQVSGAEGIAAEMRCRCWASIFPRTCR